MNMEASKVLKNDSDRSCENMTECHQHRRIDRMEDTMHKMSIDMAKLTTNSIWILRLNLFLAGTLVTAIIGAVVHLLTK